MIRIEELALDGPVIAGHALTGDKIYIDIRAPAIWPFLPKPDVLYQIAVLRILDEVVGDKPFEHADFAALVSRQIPKLLEQILDFNVGHAQSSSESEVSMLG